MRSRLYIPLVFFSVLEVKAAGTSYLEFDGTELFRDPDNNDITINETVDGLVIVE